MADGVILSPEAFQLIRQVVKQVIAEGVPPGRPRPRTLGPIETIRYIAKTTDAHARGATQDIDLYIDGDALADGTVEAYSRFTALPEDWWCYVDFVAGQYEIVAWESLIQLGQTTEAIAVDNTGSVQFQSGSETGETIEAFNRYADLPEGAACHVIYLAGTWEILAANPCEEEE